MFWSSLNTQYSNLENVFVGAVLTPTPLSQVMMGEMWSTNFASFGMRQSLGLELQHTHKSIIVSS